MSVLIIVDDPFLIQSTTIVSANNPPIVTTSYSTNFTDAMLAQALRLKEQQDGEAYRWPLWTSWFEQHEIPVDIRPPANAPTPRAAAIRLHHGNRGDRRRRQAAVRIIAKRAA